MPLQKILSQKITIISFAVVLCLGLVWFVFNQRQAGQPAVREAVSFEQPLKYSEPLVIKVFGQIFSFQPLGASAAEFRQEQANRVRYINAYAETDVVQTSYERKLKEDIILKTPGHPKRFEYVFDAGRFDAGQDMAGNIIFYEKGKAGDGLRKVATIPKPFMTAAGTDEQGPVKAWIEGERLIIEPDAEWIASHEYPIVVDPTIEINVLNLNSVPIVGEEWSVEFTTRGRADLIIEGDLVNTVFGTNVAYAMLKCGDEEVVPVKQDNTYVYKDWLCEQKAVWQVMVLLPGHHHQIFYFGDALATAYNDTVSDQWCSGLSSWTRRRRITLNNSSQSTALSNFPAAVFLNSSRVDYSQTQNAGEDIRFCDQDNATSLYYEIEKWNESGTSVVWVKVPNLTAASSTEHIWMYYGNAAASNNATTTGVWDDNFVLVQHFNETSSTHYDSTKYANNSTAIDVQAQGTAAGIAGGADDFEKDSTDEVIIGDSNSLDLTNAMSVEVWAKLESSATGGSFYDFVDKYTSATQYNYAMIFYEAGGSSGDNYFSFYNGADRYVEDANNVVALATWYYFVGTFDNPSNDQYLYEDGAVVASNLDNTYNPLANAGSLYIGGPVSGSYHDGLIDEVRVSNIARSADWIKFTNCNIRDTCNSYGSEEIGGGGGGSSGDSAWWAPRWQYRKRITMNNSSQSTGHTDFPLMAKTTSANTDFWSHVQDNAGDLRFVDANNLDELYFELEEWNSASDDMVAWVKVPNIAAASSTDYIWMYYGHSSGAAATSSRLYAPQVWNSNYVSVYHLDETGSDTRSDSSGSGNHADVGQTSVDEFTASEAWTENLINGSVSGGNYVASITNTSDPYFYQDITNFDPRYKVLTVRYRSYTSGPTTFKVYYTDNIDCSNFQELCSESFSITSDGNWYTLSQTITDAEWTDGDSPIIDDLRFDFEGAGTTGTVYIDYIRFVTPTPTDTTKIDGADTHPADTLLVGGTTGRPTNNFSYSAWLKTSTTHEIDAESNSSTTGTSGQKYAIDPTQEGANAGSGVSIGTNGISVYEHGSGYLPPLAVYSSTIGSDWNYVSVVYASRQPKIYLNGVLVRTGLTSGRATVYAPYKIGSGQYGSYAGSMDEFRVTSSSLTADWIAFEYCNMMQTCASFGSEESYSGGFAPIIKVKGGSMRIKGGTVKIH